MARPAQALLALALLVLGLLAQLLDSAALQDAGLIAIVAGLGLLALILPAVLANSRDGDETLPGPRQ